MTTYRKFILQKLVFNQLRHWNKRLTRDWDYGAFSGSCPPDDSDFRSGWDSKIQIFQGGVWKVAVSIWKVKSWKFFFDFYFFFDTFWSMNDSFDSVFDGFSIIWNFMLNIDIKLFFASDSRSFKFFETDSRKLRSNFLFPGAKISHFFLLIFQNLFYPILAQAPIWCTQIYVRLRSVDFQLLLIFELRDLRIQA